MRVGELLTSISVLIALLGFLYTWRKDRGLRTKEYADKVRAAAAMTLAKVDRCESLFLSFIHRIRPIFTEMNELLQQTKSPYACRDQFWKQMIAIRLSIYEQFSDEQIELAYAPLFAHQGEIYDLFKNAIEKAKQAEDKFFWDLMGECQMPFWICPIRCKRSIRLFPTNYWTYPVTTTNNTLASFRCCSTKSDNS